MKFKLICTFILTTLFTTSLLTACSAPRLPQPYGSEFPINPPIPQGTAQ